MVPATLQSDKLQELLDIVDKLRCQGINKCISLPKIIVCGDRSVGKSSVLEAISGIAFPTTDNFGTQLATELVLRRDATSSAKASIIASSDTSVTEKERLDQFSAELDPVSPDMGRAIREANEEMGLSEQKALSTDILRVELRGPNQPNFTVVDLPGLFGDENAGRSDDEKKIVERIVQGCTNQHQTIILAVVSAKNGFHLGGVKAMVHELNWNGAHALGLIINPDVLDAGSESEAACAELAQNMAVVFRFGWHVRDSKKHGIGGATSAERDEAEKRLFETGIWANMNPTQLGIKSLMPRLRNILEYLMPFQIATLMDEVESEVSACEMQLRRLEASCATDDEQAKYVLELSRKFSALMKSAVDGDYTNTFFGKAKTENGYRRRLRARVQSALADFEEEMRAKGEHRRIVSAASSPPTDGMPWTDRSTYRNEVQDLIARSRGRDLPGTFNPSVVSELFAEQCQPWEKIAATAQQNILQIVYEATHDVVELLAAEETANHVSQTIRAVLEPLESRLRDKFDELLRPHREAHPIILNDYLKNSVQQLQADRRRQQLMKAFDRLLFPQSARSYEALINPSKFFESLEKNTAADLDHYGSELAIDYMSAYYELAMKKFISDCTLAVEKCLLNELPSVLMPEYVSCLDTNKIFCTANKTKSDGCAEKLAVLRGLKSDLDRLEKDILNSHDFPHEEDQGIILADDGSEASSSASG